MCKMKTGRSGSYVRDGMSIEIVADSMDSYKELIDRGCAVFHLPNSKDGMIVNIFTMSGSMIIDSGDWTPGEYLKRTKKSEAKLGIGYVEVISSSRLALYIFYIIIFI